MALGVNSSPRHLSAGSLPLPGLSPYLSWSSGSPPVAPAGREAEGTRSPPQNHWRGKGKPRTPAEVSGDARSRPGASEPGPRCGGRPRPRAGRGAVILGPGRRHTALPGGSPAAGDARHRPRARPRLARAAAAECTPAGGPRPWRRGVPRRQPSRRGSNFLLAHKLRAPRSPDRPRDLGAPLPCPSAGGEDPALRSALARLPPPRPNPGSQEGTEGRGPGRGAAAAPGVRRLPPLGAALPAAANVGFSGARLAQVPDSSPRDAPPPRATDRPAANGEARLVGI